MPLALRKYLALSAMLAAPLAAGKSEKDITVLVYNYAPVSQEVLAQAETEAGRIYGHGGVAVGWVDCLLTATACKGPSRPSLPVVRILPRASAERLRQVQDSYGFALYPEGGGFALIANVFAHNANLLAERRGLPPGVVLGHLLAHEIGHLLLGPGSHGWSGIMKAAWHGQDLETMAKGQMLFSTGELEEMRRNIAARIGAVSSNALAGGLEGCGQSNASARQLR